MKATATYSVKKWEEVTTREIAPGEKLTKASVLYELQGGLDGKASVEYLMFYRHFDPADPHKSSAAYVGLIQFEGTMDGKSGTFFLEDTGTFDAGEARSQLRIIEGSGTGQFENIHGAGSYVANKGGYRWDLEFEFR